MKKRKQDFIQFVIWFRNGFTFCTTWFLILLLAHHYFLKIQTISTKRLIYFLLWLSGGVLIFDLCFTRLVIRRWGFTKRLTLFMGAVSFYECFGICSFNLSAGERTIGRWLIFAAIVFILYLASIAIYQSYSKKQGSIYTQALRQYQQDHTDLLGK